MRFKINICTVAQCLEVHTSFPLISILCWLDKECAAVRPEQSTSQFVSSNSANTENLSSRSRPRLIENEDGFLELCCLQGLGFWRGWEGCLFLQTGQCLLWYAIWIFQGWVWTLHENYYLFFVINNMFMPKLSWYICAIPRLTATNALDGEVMKVLNWSIWYHMEWPD